MHIPSLLQAIFSGLGLAVCILGAGSFLVGGAAIVFTDSGMMRDQAGAVLSMGFIAVLLAGLAATSLVFAVRRLNGGTAPVRIPSRARGLRLASLALLLWPLALAAGRLISEQGYPADLLLAPLHLAAVALPVWWLTALATEGLSAPSGQRVWGALNFSVFGSTPLVIAVEGAMGLATLVGVVIYVSGQPALASQLEELSQRLLYEAQNPQWLAQFYEPLLVHPLFIFGLLAALGGVTPLIEELLKPLAVWALAGRNISAGEGFTLGALSGAGFALVESLFSLANTVNADWLGLAFGRAGTAVLHITTAAFMGWALAEAWKARRFARLGLTYCAMAVLHGVWNVISISSGYADLLANKDGLLGGLALVGQAAPYLLGGLAAAMLVLVILANTHLRRMEWAPALAEQTN